MTNEKPSKQSSMKIKLNGGFGVDSVHVTGNQDDFYAVGNFLKKAMQGATTNPDIGFSEMGPPMQDAGFQDGPPPNQMAMAGKNPIPPEGPYPPFDAQGSGYDYQTANELRLGPGPNYHWPTRAEIGDNGLGMILKGANHPTWNLGVQGETDAGYQMSLGGEGLRPDRFYSQLVNGPTNNSGFMNGNGSAPQSAAWPTEGMSFANPNASTQETPLNPNIGASLAGKGVLGGDLSKVPMERSSFPLAHPNLTPGQIRQSEVSRYADALPGVTSTWSTAKIQDSPEVAQYHEALRGASKYLVSPRMSFDEWMKASGRQRKMPGMWKSFLMGGLMGAGGDPYAFQKFKLQQEQQDRADYQLDMGTRDQRARDILANAEVMNKLSESQPTTVEWNGQSFQFSNRADASSFANSVNVASGKDMVTGSQAANIIKSLNTRVDRNGRIQSLIPPDVLDEKIGQLGTISSKDLAPFIDFLSRAQGVVEKNDQATIGETWPGLAKQFQIDPNTKVGDLERIFDSYTRFLTGTSRAAGTGSKEKQRQTRIEILKANGYVNDQGEVTEVGKAEARRYLGLRDDINLGDAEAMQVLLSRIVTDDDPNQSSATAFSVPTFTTAPNGSIEVKISAYEDPVQARKILKSAVDQGHMDKTKAWILLQKEFGRISQSRMKDGDLSRALTKSMFVHGAMRHGNDKFPKPKDMNDEKAVAEWIRSIRDYADKAGIEDDSSNPWFSGVDSTDPFVALRMSKFHEVMSNEAPRFIASLTSAKTFDEQQAALKKIAKEAGLGDENGKRSTEEEKALNDWAQAVLNAALMTKKEWPTDPSGAFDRAREKYGRYDTP